MDLIFLASSYYKFTNLLIVGLIDAELQAVFQVCVLSQCQFNNLLTTAGTKDAIDVSDFGCKTLLVICLIPKLHDLRFLRTFDVFGTLLTRNSFCCLRCGIYNVGIVFDYLHMNVDCRSSTWRLYQSAEAWRLAHSQLLA